jgi:DNA polymerase III subunit alpha
MTAPEFVHLHVHSEYSLLDGANRISNLVAAAVKDQQPALALTDHGNLFGAIELYKACKDKGIKPILGCEVYLARESRLTPHHRERNPYSHLTLLAHNLQGYHNLLKLTSLSYLEGYHVRPRIDRELLGRHAQGLTCLSGCLSSEVNKLIRTGHQAAAEDLAIGLRDLFGPRHFWLELQRNGISIQDECNAAMIEIAGRTGIPLVATNDIHYLRQEDCEVQDVLLCINTGAKRSDQERFKMDTKTLFFRTREEMGAAFHDLPQALRATMEVAEQVELKIEFGKYHVPVFTPDDGGDPDALFDRLLEEGLKRKYGADNTRARERLEHESKAIRQLGFVSYFLIVWDLIAWARRNGVPVGPGRGSAAGSIVAYLLDITKVCPLRYDLLFERFLNAARVSMPDIDIDFCKEGREKVLAYTRQRYGSEYVAQIVTFGTMASRTAVRDVGRALDIPLRDIDVVAKKIPSGPNAPTLREALDTDEDLIKVRQEHPELAELFELSMELEGQVRHISTHAAGVVIADRPITDYVPLCTQGEDVSTQWPAPQLEELGLLKMDYLGLRTLTILERTLRNIEKMGGSPPDLDNLPEGDPATYKMLTQGDTLGVFQLESDGMKKLLARLKPDCFEDLIAALALYRPGPLESGMIEMFVRRKHGQEEILYPHPSMESILKDTYGCIVYQEQVMLISNHLSGFSLNEADNLRKAMGKKKPEIMEKFSAQFLAGAEKNGCARQVAQEVWDNIIKFGGYGFNKSHSTAYALITYQTAYLKANHRVAFLASNMSCEMHDSDKIRAFLGDCKRSKLKLLPPDMRQSGWEFEPEPVAAPEPNGQAPRQAQQAYGIRFGLGAIKGTGQKAIEALLNARREHAPGAQLAELCGGVDQNEVTKLTWEALIKAGAWDFTGSNRGVLAASLETLMAEGAKIASDRKSGQGSLFGGFGAEATPTRPVAQSLAARSGRARQPEASEPGAWSPREILKAEREALGFYLSGHPLDEYQGLVRLLSNCPSSRLGEFPPGSEVSIAGMVTGLAVAQVKSGKWKGAKMARFQLEDLDGAVAVTVFPKAFEALGSSLAEDALLVVSATLEEREESSALLLKDALTFEVALGRFQGALVVSLDPEDREKLPPLKQLMQTRKGGSSLYFDVRGTDGQTRRVRAGGDGVAISADLVRELDQLLEPGRVQLARR